jgi:hypothetical protein
LCPDSLGPLLTPTPSSSDQHVRLTIAEQPEELETSELSAAGRAGLIAAACGALSSQQLVQALLPWLAQIFWAMAVCSAGDALSGEPVPPYAAHVLGRIW